MKNLKLIYFSLLLLVSNLVVAQSVNPPKPGKGPPPGLPIDTSLWILGVIAIGLGVYMIYKKNLKQVK